LKQFEFKVSIHVGRARDTVDVREWLIERFGPRFSPLYNENGKWAMFWNKDCIYDVYFANDEDRFFFVLSWGELILMKPEKR